MIRFFKIKGTVIKIKDLVLAQKNDLVIQLYMINGFLKFEYNNQEELDRDFKIIQERTISYCNESMEDLINMNYISSAKIETFNNADWLIVKYNKDVRINLPNTIYLGEAGKVDKDLILNSIGESDYEFFLSLY